MPISWDCDAAHNVAAIAALVARGAVAADKPPRFVEVKGGNRNPAALRDLSDAELARHDFLLDLKFG